MAVQNHKSVIGIILFVWMGVGNCMKCDVHLFVPPHGVISSPKYPEPYDNNINCMWHINSTEPNAVIVLSFEALDIEPDEPNMCGGLHQRTRACCKHNWLTVPLSGRGHAKSQQLCGSRLPTKPILVHASEAIVKMHTSKINQGGRGFRLAYKIVTQECSTPGMVPCGPHADDGCYDNHTQRCDGRTDCVGGQDEAGCTVTSATCQYQCANGVGCYGSMHKCDGNPDCQDFSDEVNCGLCEKGKVLCSKGNHHCFHPLTERCDGRFDCPWGEDEVGCVPGCENKIACTNGEGCYSPPQRCDTFTDCPDLSDEMQCPSELCALLPDKRQCHNGHCLQASLWCDGTDDCGDNSDETACLKNSMIALAIIGSLFCGLLLVVAVGCAFRVYGQHYPSSSRYHLHITPHLASRLRMSTSVSLPTLVDDEFFHREPPPAYSVAVGATEASCVPALPTRPRRSRRQRPRPVPPPQVAVKPPDSPVPTSQSSPSRSSLSSSTDDTLLLSS